jgi:hypothetical protein
LPGGVRRVHPDNVVVAGGLAPFRDISGYVLAQDKNWAPLSFMRELLCMSKSLKPTCKTRVTFDVCAQHPYTSGSPTHSAALPNDVSLGDLPKVRRLLRAAQRPGHIASHGPARFWVTEFSWDSSPPDPKAVPMDLLSRWVAEALYRTWSNDVELVTWLMLRDDPLNGGLLQSGLWFRGATVQDDKPKPILEAFRFPVVAFPRRSKVSVWVARPRVVEGAWRCNRAFPVAGRRSAP